MINFRRFFIYASPSIPMLRKKYPSWFNKEIINNIKLKARYCILISISTQEMYWPSRSLKPSELRLSDISDINKSYHMFIRSALHLLKIILLNFGTILTVKKDLLVCHTVCTTMVRC